MSIRFLQLALLSGALCVLPLQVLAEKQSRAQRVSVKPASRPADAGGPAYARRPDAMALADEIAARHELDRRWVRRVIAQARHLSQVVQLITPPPTTTPKNWQQYRSRFIDPARIRAGAEFWRQHRETLARATATYGVPADIIVGILGVETYYGRHLGKYRVLDALTTLALDFPEAHPRAAQRSAFFRQELGVFLSLRGRTGSDLLELRGSYAGAMGMPQFMPSSWARYAVDFDGDGRIDLFGNPVDVIGSVANYFKQFNWQPGMPTHYAVDFDYDRLDMQTLLAPDIRPTFPVAHFTAKGVVLDEGAMGHVGPLALVELQNGDYSPSYVAGTENFYAVTRYNWSSYYALAVIELGQAVAGVVPPASAAQASTTLSNTGCSASTQSSTSDAPTCR